jgi:hypothetical protein
MATETKRRVTPTGIICPKDPKRESDDPDDPPTHTQLEVLEVDDHGSKTAAEAAKKRTARLRCLTPGCEHEFQVKPWPPKVEGPPAQRSV